MKRTPIQRKTPLRSTGRPKPKKRRASDFKRVYGSEERVEWVKSLPCVGCGVVGFSDNAHVCGNDGTSRKANADTIAPLCHDRPGVTGCHTLYDQHKAPFSTETSRRLIRVEAYVTARAWRAQEDAA